MGQSPISATDCLHKGSIKIADDPKQIKCLACGTPLVWLRAEQVTELAMNEFSPTPGWLARQAHGVSVDTACWSPQMREAAGISTKDLSPAARAEAVKRLRQWAEDLEKEGEIGGR